MAHVSVVIPVYNAERHLGECLDSILGQTLKDIEVICVDDGSTDGSAKMLAEYAARDPRLRHLSSAHGGAGAARNRGLDEAGGEYLLFCDADDWLDRGALGALYRMAKASSSDVALTGMRYFDDATRDEYRVWTVNRKTLGLPRTFAPDLLGERLFTALRAQMGGRLFRRAFVRDLGIRFQEQPRVNDLAFVATALALAERISVDDSARYHYRKNQGGNLSSGIDRMPEMSAHAWLRVREDLIARGKFERFRAAFSRAASQSLVEVVASMRDADAMEKFFKKAQAELIPALGLERGQSVESACPFFDADSPLPILIDRLASSRRRYDDLRAKVFAFRRHPFLSFCRFFRRRFA